MVPGVAYILALQLGQRMVLTAAAHSLRYSERINDSNLQSSSAGALITRYILLTTETRNKLRLVHNAHTEQNV